MVFAAMIFTMEAIFRLNTSEMGNDFINSIKTAYPDQNVEIMVRQQDETDYLLSFPANRDHLLKAIKEEKLIAFETAEQARKYAEEWAVKQ